MFVTDGEGICRGVRRPVSPIQTSPRGGKPTEREPRTHVPGVRPGAHGLKCERPRSFHLVTDCDITPLMSQVIRSLRFFLFGSGEKPYLVGQPDFLATSLPPDMPMSSGHGVKFPSRVSGPHFFSPQGITNPVSPTRLHITVHARIHTRVSATMASIHCGFQGL